MTTKSDKPKAKEAMVKPALGRLIDALAAQDAKEYLAEMTTNREPPGKPGPVASKRLRGAPREVGPVWSLSDSEKLRFDRVNGVSTLLEKLHPPPHPADRDILFNGLAAAIGFHELSKIIDRLYFQDDSVDVREELEQVRVAFELALQAMDQALGDRYVQLDRARAAAMVKHARDPKQKAKAEASALWKEWKAGQHPNIRRVADFATEVMRRWPVLKNAKVIENWSSQWTKDRKNGNTPAS